MESSEFDILEMLKNIKLFAFDMDGVLRIGSNIIEGAENIFKNIKNINKNSLIITNECRYTCDQIKEDLIEMGIKNVNNIPIITSGSMVYEYIQNKINRFSNETISLGIIGEQGLFDTINPITRNNLVEICEIPPTYKSKKYLIIGSVNNIKISNLKKVLKWTKAGAKIILTCGDISDPSSKGDLNLGMPKHILYMTNFNIQTPTSYSIGKPNPLVAQQILKTYPDIKSEEVLLIGDTIYTDIQLAEENNFKSLLVLSGNTSKDGIKSYVTEADYILKSIKELNNLILKYDNNVTSPT